MRLYESYDPLFTFFDAPQVIVVAPPLWSPSRENTISHYHTSLSAATHVLNDLYWLSRSSAVEFIPPEQDPHLYIMCENRFNLFDRIESLWNQEIPDLDHPPPIHIRMSKAARTRDLFKSTRKWIDEQGFTKGLFITTRAEIRSLGLVAFKNRFPGNGISAEAVNQRINERNAENNQQDKQPLFSNIDLKSFKTRINLQLSESLARLGHDILHRATF